MEITKEAKPAREFRIFDKNQINFGDFLGEGSYGKVLKATIGQMRKPVAIKILRSPLKNEETHSACIKMLVKISSFSHYNLVSFLGISAEKSDECMQLVWGHVDGETLLNFAKSKNNKKQISNKLLLDTICGMEYLHSMGVIHRHLSARNILLDHYPNAKITDYVTECTFLDGQGGNYYKFEVENDYPSLQIRWSSQELIPFEVKKSLGFSSDFETIYGGFPADIWSFGVVVFEVLSKGEVPYGIATSNIDVLKGILQGYNPLTFSQKKYNISEDYVSMMQKIFIPDPDKRPKFDEIHKISLSICTKDGFYKPTNMSTKQKEDKPRDSRPQNHQQKQHSDGKKDFKFNLGGHQPPNFNQNSNESGPNMKIPPNEKYDRQPTNQQQLQNQNAFHQQQKNQKYYQQKDQGLQNQQKYQERPNKQPSQQQNQPKKDLPKLQNQPEKKLPGNPPPYNAIFNPAGQQQQPYQQPQQQYQQPQQQYQQQQQPPVVMNIAMAPPPQQQQQFQMPFQYQMPQLVPQMFQPQVQPQVVIQSNPQVTNFEQENKIRDLEQAVKNLEMKNKNLSKNKPSGSAGAKKSKPKK